MRTIESKEAAGRLDAVLSEVNRDGGVVIRAENGSEYVVRPFLDSSERSPFENVESVDLGLTAEEIVGFVREGRERGE